MKNPQYHYDPESRLFTHRSPQMPDPKSDKGEFLPVLNATPDPLPALTAHQTARRADDDTSWEVVPDYRGTAWRIDTKEPLTIENTGPLPDGVTYLQPGAFDEWKGDQWQYSVALECGSLLPTIEDAINRGCAAAIVAGFTSAALGADHTYPGDLEDQLNISGNVLMNADVPQKCTDAGGVKEYRIHTAAQMRQVGEDLAAHKLAQLQKADTLKKQAAAACDVADIAALKAIGW